MLENLTERVRWAPYSVILLDEIEKARPDIADLLIQVPDEGILTDAHGDTVDFRNALIVMTSNLGTRDVSTTPGTAGFGSGGPKAFAENRETALRELRRHFPPEFLNRLDDVVVSAPLSQEQLRRVCVLSVGDVVEHLAGRGIRLTVPDEVHDWLLGRAGADAGARPLRRAVQRHLEDAVSDDLIHHREGQGPLVAAVEDERLVVTAWEGVCS